MKLTEAIRTHRSSWLGKAITALLRVVVGGTFVFSGFVKAIDPTGSYYKFNEYAQALGWHWLLSFTLFAAFAIAAVEFALGLLLLVGAYRRSAPILMLLMMLVMLPLTLWLAITNAVPDCGCFGDAWVIGNWATFGKNVALTIALIYLVVCNRGLRGLYGPGAQWVALVAAIAYPLALSTVGYATQPLLDFRPFKVGTHLLANEPPTVADTDYVFIYEKNGQQRQFGIDSLPGDDWTYVDRRLNPAKEKQIEQPPAQNALTIYDHGNDVTSEVLDTARNQLLILFPDLSGVNISYTFVINELCDFAQARGVDVVGLTSGTADDIAAWNDISMAAYPLYNADDSQLKAIARGNPAVVYVQGGVIKWKRTLSSIKPSRLTADVLTLDQLGDDLRPSHYLRQFTTTLAVVLVALLVLNRTHVVVRLIRRKRARGKMREKSKKQ